MRFSLNSAGALLAPIALAAGAMVATLPGEANAATLGPGEFGSFAFNVDFDLTVTGVGVGTTDQTFSFDAAEVADFPNPPDVPGPFSSFIPGVDTFTINDLTVLGIPTGTSDFAGFSVAGGGPLIEFDTGFFTATSLSELEVIDFAGGSVINFSVNGLFDDEAGSVYGGDVSFTSIFSAPSDVDALAAVLAGGGTISNSAAGTGTSVPEPFTIIGSALALGAGAMIKRRRSAAN